MKNKTLVFSTMLAYWAIVCPQMVIAEPDPLAGVEAESLDVDAPKVSAKKIDASTEETQAFKTLSASIEALEQSGNDIQSSSASAFEAFSKFDELYRGEVAKKNSAEANKKAVDEENEELKKAVEEKEAAIAKKTAEIGEHEQAEKKHREDAADAKKKHEEKVGKLKQEKADAEKDHEQAKKDHEEATKKKEELAKQRTDIEAKISAETKIQRNHSRNKNKSHSPFDDIAKNLEDVKETAETLMDKIDDIKKLDKDEDDLDEFVEEFQNENSLINQAKDVCADISEDLNTIEEDIKEIKKKHGID